MKENWKKVTLGDHAEFRKGKGISKGDLSNKGKYPCIHYGELYTKYGSSIDRICSYTDNPPSNPVLSSLGDVLFPTSDVTPSGLATASCLNQDGVILGGDILIVKLDTSVINEVFFTLLVRSFKDKVLNLITGTTVYHLTSKSLEKLSFYVPPTIDEQKEIARMADETVARKSLLVKKYSDKINKVSSLSDGIVKKLLSGSD